MKTLNPRADLSASGSYIRLETTGRRSGRPHQVILRYITYGGKIIVFSQSGSDPDWVANIASSPKVRVLGEGRIIEGVAGPGRILSFDDPILKAFTRKYGSSTVRRRYWGQLDYIAIEPVDVRSALDLEELAYGDLEAAFDGVAPDYDRHIFGNPINVWLRNRSVGLMAKVFRPGQTVLEVGCGTGTETISLAKMGIRVVATDISSRMLEVLMEHAREASVGDLVIPVHCRPYQLRAILREKGFPRVDGAYSTYGAVNTEPRLPDFFAGLHSLIADGGSLVLGVWNRFCLYEMLGYMLKANPSMAAARLRNPVPVGRSRFCVTTNAFSAGTLAPAMHGLFALKEVHGVGIFLPPSNLTKYLPPAALTRFLQWADVTVESAFPWNRLGDHFLAVYTKTG
jgi:SAM-dependent methyltransferase